MNSFDYDLFVIGAGSGGVRAARIAAEHGAKVAIAEEYRVGGTCVIRGCVPKKLLSYAAHFADDFADAAGYGWQVADANFDWPTLIANKDKEIDRLNRIYTENLKKAGVELFHSRAVLRAGHSVYLVGEERHISAKYILIATGGRADFDVTLPGIEHAISSNEAFHLNRLPEKIIIAGGGYIALEFASIFNGLGAETILIYRGPKVLRGFDEDIRTLIQESLIKRGVQVICNDVFSRIDKMADGLQARTRAGKTLKADQIMFAIGRSPNTDGLGLAQVDVALDDKGAIKVNTQSQTSVPHIYAVGDVTNRVNLTPVAIREGHAFADTVFGGKNSAVDHRLIPTAVFTNPEVGAVGLTEEEAREHCKIVEIYKSSFRPMKHILPGREEKMLLKLITDGQTGRVLGCHIAGPDAAEMIQLIGICLKMGATKADFDATMAVHPTAAEELVTMHTPAVRYVRD